MIEDHEIDMLRQMGITCNDLPSKEEIQVRRWDEWFNLVGIGEHWQRIKQTCAEVSCTHAEIIRWAEITELTRLSEIESQKANNERDQRTATWHRRTG